jgi:glucosamine--fructose-6-phosphate aminotransferase (isomerizing)
MRAEMADQAPVLEGLVDRFDDLVAAIAAIRPAQLAGTVLLGRGPSRSALTYARYLIELSSGRPVAIAAPSLQTRYVADTDYRGYVVVAYSQSGRTPEIVAAAERMRANGARVVAMTNQVDGALAAVADAVLAVDTGPARAVPATKAVTAQMLASLAVATALGRDGHELVPAAELAHLPAAVRSTLADSEPARALANRWAGRSRMLVIARGLGVAAAAETAAKVRETSGVFAQGMSAADLLHGPIASVHRALPILLVDVGGPARHDVLDLVTRLTQVGADVAFCAAHPSAQLPVFGELSEPLATIVATVRGHQLAFEWSCALGLDPDSPEGLSSASATG